MRLLSLSLLLSSSLAIAAVACGGISDPTKSDGRVATVSGALTGLGTSVPANARVALVWRKAAGGVEVGADVPVVAGRFTMSLAMPAEAYFSNIEANAGSSVMDDAPSTPPSSGPVPAPDPAPSPGTSSSGGSSSGGGAAPAFSTKLSPRDTAVGGTINTQLSGAIAGFVVYADANGNGALDLSGEVASTPDTILGGNNDLLLVFFRNGGTLDYEKLRDKASVLPTPGFNLAWEEGRWLPLDAVELKLNTNEKLPSPVCSGGLSGGSSGGAAEPATTEARRPSSGSSTSGSTGTDASVPSYYPAPGSPGLMCTNGGRSFFYSPPCTPPPPRPVGLCSNYIGDSTSCAGGFGSSLPDGAAVPAGWPCPVSGALDGGPAPDPGTSSSGGGGSDGGAFDGGSGS